MAIGNFYSRYLIYFALTDCTGLDSTWTAQQLTTPASFPVPAGTVITVSCSAGYTLGGDDIVSCTGGTDFSHDGTAPSCKLTLGYYNLTNYIKTT